MQNIIKLLILDIDGVLTDGRKTCDTYGNTISKNFCDKDWTSIKRFKSIGVDVVFLTGDEFNLGIGVKRNIDTFINKENGNLIDKQLYLNLIKSKYNVTHKEIAYCGDDIFDLGILQNVVYAFCPSDAPQIVKKECIVLNGRGGDNLVQEIFELCENRGFISTVNYLDFKNNLYKLDRGEKINDTISG